MESIQEQIRRLEQELSECVSGYISHKMIGGKERLYLQWTENGKLKSRYLKAGESDAVCASVERRRQLQEQLKRLRATPEGVQANHLKRRVVRSLK